MTAMATEPQGRARVKPGKIPPARIPPQPPPAPRGRRVPLTPMRQVAAKSMSRLADHVQQAHPDMLIHQHVRDAARMLRAGNEEAAQRHLRAAMFALTPTSLMRNGVHDDTGHIAARHAMHGVHRHLLLVKDIADVAERNQRAIARDSYGDLESAPSLPSSPVHADPNAGYGPGALAQKPVARQPGGDRALNAPDRTNSGGSDPNVADPVGRQPKGSRQFSYTWDDLAVVIDLAARNGVHIPGTDYNWRHTYIPLTEAAARSHGHGKVPKGWSPPGGGGSSASRAAGKASAAARVAASRPSGMRHGTTGDTAEDAKRAAAAQANAKADIAAVTRQVRDGTAAKIAAAREANARAAIASSSKSAKQANARAESAMTQKGGLKHPGTARHVVAAQKEANAGRFGNAIGHLEKADSLEAHQGVPAGKDSRQKIAATITSLRARQAVAVRKDRAAAKAKAATSPPKSVRKAAGNEKQLQLLSERATGGDKTSGEMKAGDMQEGHQAIAQAPTSLRSTETHQKVNGHLAKGAFSDPWWMAKPGGGFAISQRWQSKAQTSYGHVNGKYTSVPVPAADKRVLTPISATDAAGLMRTQAASAATTNSMWAGGARRLQLHATSWDEVAAVIELAWIPNPSKAQWAAIDAKSGHSLPDQKGGGDEDKADAHIHSARQAAATGQHQVAMKHLARASALTADPAKQKAVNDYAGKVVATARLQGKPLTLARTWDDVAAVVELSARTAQLERTPAPRGKPGGPGLYDVKGMGHTAYEQQIVKALIEKRGMDPHRAYAIARGAIRRWMRGGGHVTPEVRAAAAGAEAGELEKQARAKAAHGHATTWGDVAAVVELAAAAPGWDGVAAAVDLAVA